MKYFTTAFALLVMCAFTQTAQADFGSFFTDEAPVGLEGTPQDVLSEILAIEPAAGDEEEVVAPEVEGEAENPATDAADGETAPEDETQDEE
ncbi:MAG: hypothetical protein ACRBCT_08450 [Alphaproteobacteria bacterium]